MVSITINNQKLSCKPDTTILAAAQEAGIDIPNLCYYKNLSEIASCRMCVVEVEGRNDLLPACSTRVEEGMSIQTHTPKTESVRKLNLELLQARHDRNCETCVRHTTCKLEDLFERYETPKDSFAPELVGRRKAAWNPNCIIQKDFNKCILCGRCVMACKKIQGTKVWNYIDSGSRTRVGVNNLQSMVEAGCVSCGQCITHCPTGALTERDDTARLKAAIADPNKIVAVQIAPAARTAWAAGLGVDESSLSVERMCAALHVLGVDYVFDTAFSADLTIMEEASELVRLIKENKTDALPLFTSCCPGWMTHVRNAHPDLLGHISTAKSPMMMFGAVLKAWFAPQIKVAPEQIFSVALMPCTAKKHEITLPGGTSCGTVPDMDLSLTTSELIRMIQEAQIDVTQLEDESLDNPLGEATGAGMIFGVTGGVMEAALRSAHYFITGTLAPPFAFEFISREFPWKEAEFEIEGRQIRCAVAASLNQADELISALQEGDVSYDFIEVMACPGGCSGGGGQPISALDEERGLKRGEVLKKLDRSKMPLRYSHENPLITKIYSEWLAEPGSPRAHEYLHIDHFRIKREVPEKKY